MRRLVAIAVLGLAVAVLVVVGVGAGGDDDNGTYRVRAMFDNASSAVPGEDVKVAGGKVGVVESMDVTKDHKAALVLRIDDAGFAPFHADADCAIRPQSLIGEKYIECNPGRATAPTLTKIEHGDGEGEYLLPLARTSAPVDLDLVNDISRRPVRERLSIILSELGAAFAGRGGDLNEVLRRANPALRETDEVLAILARQNRQLARLAVDGDRALAPLARERRRVTGFVDRAGDTAAAAAERRADIGAGLRRLPASLRELRLTMRDLRGFANDATPVATALNASGNDVSRLIKGLAPFSKVAEPAFTSLGKAAAVGRPALLRARPLVRDVRGFARAARPLSNDLDKLTASIDKQRGIEGLAELIYFNSLSINGFDSTGHYERANLLTNTCTTFAATPNTSCLAHFGDGVEGSSAAVKAEAAARPQAGAAAAAAGGEVAPEGALVGGILGKAPSGASRDRIDGLRRSREDAEAAAGVGAEPALDYLMGN